MEKKKEGGHKKLFLLLRGMGITEREREAGDNRRYDSMPQKGEKTAMGKKRKDEKCFFVLRPSIAPLLERPSNPPHAMEEEGKFLKMDRLKRELWETVVLYFFFQARA